MATIETDLTVAEKKTKVALQDQIGKDVEQFHMSK